MKIFNKTSIVALLAILMGCQTEDYECVDKQKEQVCLLQTYFEEFDEEKASRSTIDFSGKVYWTKSDAIGVFGDNNQNVNFTYTGDHDSIGVFKGVYDNQRDPIQFACFPYDEKTVLNDDALSFTIPMEQKYTSENVAPMIGLPLNDHVLKFHQTGGVLQLKWRDLPSAATKVKIVASGDSPFLSGNATISDVKNVHSTFKITEGQKELTYTLTKKSDQQNALLFVPLQVGMYEQIQVLVTTQTDSVVQQYALSNVSVRRGKVIRTPYIGDTSRLEYMELSEQITAQNGFDYSIVTNKDWVAAYDEREDETTRFTYADLNASDQKYGDGMMHVVTDSLERVISVITKDIRISVFYKDQQKFDVLLISENGISEVKDCELPAVNFSTRAISRSGLRESKIFLTIDNVTGIISLVKGLVTSTLEEIILDNVKNALIAKYANEIIKNSIDFIEKGTKERITAILAFMENCYNDFNRKEFNRLCGDLAIHTLEPKVVGDKLIFGYEISNTASLPKSLKGNEKISRQARLFLYKVPNGKGITENRIIHGVGGEKFGSKEVESDGEEIFEVTFEEGYTYFMASSIEVVNKYVQLNPNSQLYGQEFADLFYYDGEIKYKATNAIKNLKIKSIDFDSRNLIFDFYLYPKYLPTYQEGMRHWRVEFLCDGQPIQGLPIYEDAMILEKHAKLMMNSSQMNLDVEKFKATTSGRWQAVSVYDFTQGLHTQSIKSEPVDLELVYDEKPSIEFIDAKVDFTEEIDDQSRANNDDKSTKYKTYYKYKLDLHGCFWMKRYMAKSDIGGPIFELSNPRPPLFDELTNMYYYWIYSKDNPISPNLWVDAILLDGNTLRSVNTLQFSGNPINKVISY